MGADTIPRAVDGATISAMGLTHRKVPIAVASSEMVWTHLDCYGLCFVTLARLPKFPIGVDMSAASRYPRRSRLRANIRD